MAGLSKVLVANRGEIALRIIRACRREGIATVAVYSDADETSQHVWLADEAVRIGPPAATASYLKPDVLLHVAQSTGCDGIHPGYGFLSERASFAAACEKEGVRFIGPGAEQIRLMGDKAEARRTAIRLNVPVVPGSEDTCADAGAALAAAGSIGFPVLMKARAGGGGRGMRVAQTAESLPALFTQARNEAEAAFGDGGLYLERYFANVRHIEVQVLGDTHGNVRHVWERDCSTQRRHQKLVEEAPSPVLDAETRLKMCLAAEELARGIGYVGAGTVEFLYDPASGEFFFIEMNTRIQVEHPVTESIVGIDLVAEQLRIAAGEPMSIAGGTPPASGHAIEFRINAEDPDKDFRPSPGRIRRWRPPAMDGVRFDSHAYEGYFVPPYYDSLLGKLIVTGTDRADAVERAKIALSAFEVEGVATTIPFHLRLLDHADFGRSLVHTRWVESGALNTGEQP